MAFKTYANRGEMERAGWDFTQTGEAKACRQCGELIQWCISPKGKNISLDADSCAVHFTHCGAQSATRPASTPSSTTRPATATAPATSLPATGDLQGAITDLTVAIRALLAELKSRQRAPSTPAPAPHRGRVDRDGCPQ
jgi:hypothetical protein